jgi:hypothetical protein
MFTRQFVLFLTTALICCGFAYSKAFDENDVYIEINKNFPDSLKVRLGQKSASFEFCPDNTCDLVKASNAIPEEIFFDVVYVYVYYFSTYYVLDDWRAKTSSISLAKKITTKNMYAECKQGSDMRQAYCIIQLLTKKYDLKYFFVRYDEKEKHVVRMPPPSIK